MTRTVSVIIITKNEEQNIAQCLESVSWADEIVVIDAESTDQTVAFARRFTQHVFVEPWKGFSAAKSLALSRATSEWILWIDADERVTPELALEIQEMLRKDSGFFDGFRIARRAYFLGKWIRHCGWYPGYVLRLFRKSHARFSNSSVHESVLLEGSLGTLRNDLLHFTDNDLDHYFVKYNNYTTLAAQDLLGQGRDAGLIDLFIRPLIAFLKMYVVKLGFLDGLHGLILCKFSASYVFTKYAKLWHLEMVQSSSPEKNSGPRESS